MIVIKCSILQYKALLLYSVFMANKYNSCNVIDMNSARLKRKIVSGHNNAIFVIFSFGEIDWS